MSLSKTAKGGDQRATLEAMRDDLALAMELADPAVKAQLSGQLRRVLEDLRGLPEEDRHDSVLDKVTDELAQLRESKTGSGTPTGAAARKPRKARSQPG